MNRAALIAGLKRLNEPRTAPYEEREVRAALHRWLNELALPFEVDPFGNTLVRVRYGHPRRQLAFVAHLDHPAFRVTDVKGNEITCTADGGLPTIGIKGARVVFPHVATGTVSGRVTSAKIAVVNGRPHLELAKIKVNPKGPTPEVGQFAVFDLPPFKQTGNRLKLRVADDLAGVVVIVAALADLSRQTSAVDAIGVFTRAEEVGFHGSLAVAIDGRLPRDTTIVSVECSRAYGEVALGKGPVVRLGDRAGPFHPRAAGLLSGAATELAKERFQYQSALMAGGTCEATAFAAFDYAAAGLALPLVAYHNQGARGVAPEEIDVRDLEGAVRLIAAAARRAGAGVEDLDLLRNALITGSEEGRKRLREPVDPAIGYPVGSKF